MNLYEHARSRIKDFASIGVSLDTHDAYAFGYAEAAHYRQEFAKQVKILLAQQQKVKDDLFGHCLSNGVFNAQGKPFDCTEMNEVNRSIELLLKSIDNDPIPTFLPQGDPNE